MQIVENVSVLKDWLKIIFDVMHVTILANMDSVQAPIQISVWDVITQENHMLKLELICNVFAMTDIMKNKQVNVEIATVNVVNALGQLIKTVYNVPVYHWNCKIINF